MISIKPPNSIRASSMGAYIIKRRPYVSKPITHIFYGSGTTINEIAHIIKNAEKFEKNLNIQVVSIPNKNEIDDKTLLKLLPPNIKKINYQPSGIEKNLTIIKDGVRNAIVRIPSSIWRKKKYNLIIENIIKK